VEEARERARFGGVYNSEKGVVDRGSHCAIVAAELTPEGVRLLRRGVNVECQLKIENTH
jgi:hypothetical protein